MTAPPTPFNGGDPVNICSQVSPMNRMMPLTNWQNPGIQMPQTPVARSTDSLRGGQGTNSCGP